MNEIMKRLFEKVSVKDLYDEVKNDDNMVYNLGVIFFNSNKKIFIQTVRDLFKEIVDGDNESLKRKLKNSILEMDGEYEFSINKKKKARVSTTSSIICTDTDPCARGYTPPRC